MAGFEIKADLLTDERTPVAGPFRRSGGVKIIAGPPIADLQITALNAARVLPVHRAVAGGAPVFRSAAEPGKVNAADPDAVQSGGVLAIACLQAEPQPFYRAEDRGELGGAETEGLGGERDAIFIPGVGLCGRIERGDRFDHVGDIVFITAAAGQGFLGRVNDDLPPAVVAVRLVGGIGDNVL
ncbi:MAG: hypothetical protein BWY83_03324 [bacterium ADurb.Bin478]|nr:MAG: hypothetical protein BWY83_03324 [bacterium ADurb.Bin478]